MMVDQHKQIPSPGLSSYAFLSKREQSQDTFTLSPADGAKYQVSFIFNHVCETLPRQRRTQFQPEHQTLVLC